MAQGTVGGAPYPWPAPLVAVAAGVPAGVGAWIAPSGWMWAAAIGAGVACAAALLIALHGARERSRLAAIHSTLQANVATLERQVREQAELLEKSRSLDEVTGVLNRRTFLSRVDEAIQRDARLRKPLAFILVDIDGFRRLNAEHGRLVGDEALQEVARALRGATRGTDAVGRLGGDEFGAVLGECSDPRPAIDRLFVALEGRTVGHGAARLSAAVAAVRIENPQQGWDVAEILRSAEEAMVPIRGKGGGRCATRTLSREAPSAAFLR